MYCSCMPLIVIQISLQRIYYHFLPTLQASLSLKTIVVSVQVSVKNCGHTTEKNNDFVVNFFSRIPNICFQRRRTVLYVTLISLYSEVYFLITFYIG